MNIRKVYPGRELVVLEKAWILTGLVRVFTEQEIIDYIMKYNADISFRDLMETVD